MRKTQTKTAASRDGGTSKDNEANMTISLLGADSGGGRNEVEERRFVKDRRILTFIIRGQREGESEPLSSPIR